MKHYLLTRFNLGLYSENTYQIQDPEAWMAHRMELFQMYCLPSIKAQTCQEFTWLLACDPATPKKYLKYLEPFQIIYEQPHLYLRKLKPQSDWIITSRLDNDDMLLPDYVSRIQAQFDKTIKLVDVQYQALSKGQLYTSERTRPNSPFISLIEPWGEIKTAMNRPHTYMCDDYPSVWLDEVLAIQVIHDRNISNQIRGSRI